MKKKLFYFIMAVPAYYIVKEVYRRVKEKKEAKKNGESTEPKD